MAKEKITTKQAAELLGCSDRTVLRMIDQKVLHGWKLTPGLKSIYFLWREDVEKLVKQREAVAEKSS